jgi:hypothetical protein
VAAANEPYLEEIARMVEENSDGGNGEPDDSESSRLPVVEESNSDVRLAITQYLDNSKRSNSDGSVDLTSPPVPIPTMEPRTLLTEMPSVVKKFLVYKSVT